MASTIQYVCWEWLRDDRLGYSPYNPEDSYEIEKTYAINSKAKVKFKDFTVDLAKLKEESRRGSRQIFRNTNLSLPSQDICAYWMWCNQKPNGYIPYGIAATVDLEEGYQKFLNGGKEILNLAVCPCKIPYTINYSNWNQTRHSYQTVRAIKRVPLPFSQTLQFLLQAKNSPAPVSSPYSSLGFSSSILSPSSYSVSGYVASGTTSHGGGSGASIGPSTSGTGGLVSHGIGMHSGGGGSVFSSSALAGGGSSSTSASSPYSFTTPSTLSNGYHGHGYYCTTCYKFPCICTLSTSTSSVAHSHIPSSAVASGTPSFGTRSHSSSRKPGNPLTTTHTSSASASSKSRSKKKKSPVSSAASSSRSSGKSSGRSRRRKKEKEHEEEEEEVGKSYGGGRSSMMSHFKKVKHLKEKDDEPCPICMNKLSEPSGFDDEDDDALPGPSTSSPLNVYKLRRCGHKLHHSCLQMYLKNQSQDSGFQCPTCKKSYGVKTGDMPDGTMSVNKSRTPLPGHNSYGRIEITYDFRPGVYKGRHYRANGFPRVCYLPDSPKGQKVLSLLKVAWERRLTFTIGTSVTTGANDTVVWNEIHHKTESSSNHSGHGYPDPTYLDRVLLELAAQGVEENQEEEEDQDSSSSDEEVEISGSKNKPIVI